MEFVCSACGKALKARQELAGKKVKCPRCGRPVTIPQEAVSPVPGGASASPGGRPAPRMDVSPQAPVLRRSEDEPTLPPADAQTPAPRGTEQSRTGRLEHENEGPSEAVAGYTQAELTDFLAPPQAADEIGRLGPYRILKVLGAGGMGVVFKAEDPDLERAVAIKAMLPSLAASASARQRFLREAKAAAAIKHNHIVTIHQVGEEHGAPFLAMEFLEGESLDQRLKREPRLPLPAVLRIGREIAEGLDAAHERGLIHRDIKPANIWLEGRKAEVKILDFGLARLTADQSHLTQTGAIVGTPAYMAPEQAGGQNVDHRCDLFSLGCVLYRMSTGELPFKGGDTIATLLAVATENPTPPRRVNPEVPATLSELVMRLLAKKPGDRPQSARAAAETLAEIEADRTVQLSRVHRKVPAGRSGDQGKAAGKRWLLMGAGGAVVLLLGMFLLLKLVSKPAKGTLVIDVDDPNALILIKQRDAVVQDRTAQRAFTLQARDGLVEIFDLDGLPLTAEKFMLKPGGTETIKVRMAGARMGRPRLTLDFGGHTSPISRIVFTPDGKQLITGPANLLLRVSDVETGRTARLLHPPGYPTGQFALSPDGQRLAVAARYPEGEKFTYVIYLIRFADGRIERLLKGHTAGARALVFSADGRRLASAGDDRTVRVWNLAAGEPEQVLRTATPVLGLAFSPDGNRLAQFLADSYLSSLTDLSTGKVIAQIEAGKVSVYWSQQPIAWSADGTLVAACGPDGVRLWGPDGALRRHLLEKVATQSVAFSADSRRLLVTWKSGEYRAAIFDARTGKELLKAAPKGPAQPRKSIDDGTFSPDVTLAATVGGGEGVHEALIWKTADGAVVKRMAARSALAGPDLQAGWRPDGKVVAWRKLVDPASWKRGPTAFNLDTLQLAPHVPAAKFLGPVLQEGALSLKQVNGATVQVLKDGKPISDLKLAGVRGMTLVGNDRAALFGGAYRIFVFDTVTGKLLRELAMGASPTSVAPSPDGRFLLSLGNDQMLRIWNVKADKPLLLTLCVSGKDWVAWTEGGYYAASAGGERFVNWTVNHGIDKEPGYYPAEHFSKQFNRPDVIKLVLEKGSVEEPLVALGRAVR